MHNENSVRDIIDKAWTEFRDWECLCYTRPILPCHEIPWAGHGSCVKRRGFPTVSDISEEVVKYEHGLQGINVNLLTMNRNFLD